MARHRLHEETISTSVYATDRGSFRRGDALGDSASRVAGRVFRRVEIGDYWPVEQVNPPLADWEVELVEAVAAARRERGL